MIFDNLRYGPRCIISDLLNYAIVFKAIRRKIMLCVSLKSNFPNQKRMKIGDTQVLM